MRLVCLCLAASLALAAGCAFAQPAYDDYDPARLPACTVPTDIALPVWPASPTDESLVAYAQALARCPYLQADVDGAEIPQTPARAGHGLPQDIRRSDGFLGEKCLPGKPECSFSSSSSI